MSNNDTTIKVLLVQDDIEEANKLVSLLRNASYRVEPQHAGDSTDLGKKLQERNWELAIVDFHAETVPPRTVLHQIRRSAKDIPVLLLTPEYDPPAMVEGLRMGAADVVPRDQDQLIIQSVVRALNHLEQRRALRYWKRRMAESESRFENLILSSQDGIAVIQEGTYVHVNDAYAHFFGYLDREAMNLLPVFDSIAGASHDPFRRYLKPLDAEHAIDPEPIQFEGLHADGTTFLVRAEVSQIDFHGDPSLQVLVKKEALLHMDDVERGIHGDTDAVYDPAKVRLREMVDTINIAIRKATRSGEGSLLCYLHVDNFAQLQQELGLAATEQIADQLSRFLEGYIGGQSVFGRIREDAYIFLINDPDRDQGILFAEKLLDTASGQTFDTEAGSFSCTLSIGITAINEISTTADAVLQECQQALGLMRKEGRGSGVKFHEVSIEYGSSELSHAELVTIGKRLLNENILMLHYQPILGLHSASDEFYEVLVRIDTGKIQETIPDDFLFKVFKTEVGRELDRKVIRTAIAALRDKLKAAPATRLFLNLSASTIADPGFTAWLEGMIADHRQLAGHLIFQLREIDVGTNLARAAMLVEALHRLSVKTALNHYGLAINPTSVFERIKVDFVKLDGLVVENAVKSQGGVDTLKGLVRDLKSQQGKIIVPFIESPALIPTLWQTGVDYIQGRYIREPGSAMDYVFESLE